MFDNVQLNENNDIEFNEARWRTSPSSETSTSHMATKSDITLEKIIIVHFRHHKSRW